MPKRKAPYDYDDDEDLDIGEAPTTINPYEILAVPREATADEIKSAYRKAALKHHPDKVAEADKSAAHQRFQEIAFAYAVLSDERRRARYDRTGRTTESLDLDDDDFDWATFFRAQFRDVVTEATIRTFADEYRGGDEERAHVLAAYTKHRGDLDRLFREVMLSDVLDDEARFRVIIDRAIADGEVEGFPKYTEESEASRRRRVANAKKHKEREAKEAEKAAQELEESGQSRRKEKNAGKADGTAGLAALIQQRQKSRADDFFSNLEAKYAPSGKKGRKREPMEEPSEEAFAKNAKKKAVAADDAGERMGRKKRAKK